jgi:hypothetical protein
VRPRWERVEATLVDSREHARRLRSSDGAGGSYEVREYMVDVPSRSGGKPVRLTFKEQSDRVLGEPTPGRVVPVAVNRRRTKAMFDYSDPRIDEHSRFEEQQRKRKEREDARFEARRAGLEPEPDPEEAFPEEEFPEAEFS